MLLRSGRIVCLSHNVCSTLKHFSGSSPSWLCQKCELDPEKLQLQASITGRARLPPVPMFHALCHSTASQVQGCSSQFVLIGCHDCCCIAWSASPVASEVVFYEDCFTCEASLDMLRLKTVMAAVKANELMHMHSS